MKITVFTKSYFDSKVECNSLVECKKLIHDNSDNHVRVQIDEYRLLLEPVINGYRKIDGFNDLSLTYKYFNNLTEDGLSHISVGDDGHPGGVYYSNIK